MKNHAEYLRDRLTGQLHQIQFEGREEICTIRLSDGKHVHIRVEDAILILTPSSLPGEPETTRRAA